MSTTSYQTAMTPEPIASLNHYPGNAKLHDLDVLAESLKRHGQYRPVVVQRSTRRILAGNGTVEAARERLGWDTIGVVFVDVDDDQAREIVLMDNRSGELAGYDDAALVALLQQCAETLSGLDGTGYTLDDLATLEALQATGEDTLRAVTDEMGAPAVDELWPTLTIRVPPHVRAAFYEETAKSPDDSDLGRLKWLLTAAGWEEETP